MGASCCSGKSSRAFAATNHNINQQLAKDKAKAKSEIKLLLFGAGESGKSTLFKQMKKTYSDGFTVERENVRKLMPTILSQAFLDLVDTAALVNGLGSEELNELHRNLREERDKAKSKENKNFSKNAYHIFKTLWACEAVQKAWFDRWKYQVMDSMDYFMMDENLRRICPPPNPGATRSYSYNYEPTDEDVLRLRIRTSGVIKHSFVYNSVVVNVVDVGGQRNERKKWMEVLSDVTAVLFVVALQAFDQMLFEQANQNRLTEAVNLLQSTLSFPVFTDHSFILFFNKLDLFEAKLQRMYEASPRGDLDVYFPELQLGTTWELEDGKKMVKEAITKKFVDVFKASGKDMRMFPHYVTAIDGEMFKTVFEAAAEAILSKLLEDQQQ